MWRFYSDELLREYELNRVVFGIKSSPFFALRTIRKLAQDEERQYPRASTSIARDMYVDDLIISVADLSEAKLLVAKLIAMFKTGGFDLVKWSSNSLQLMEKLPENLR